MSDDVKVKEQGLEDTFSITMELQRPLLYDKIEENKHNEENKYNVEKTHSEKKYNIKIKILMGIISIGLLGLFIWINDTYKPKDMATKALVSDELVEVSIDDFITFTPKKTKVSKGFIFYPGAKVDPKSYAPICREIAQKGYEVVIVPMPFNLAIISPDKAQKVIDKYPDIESWTIGGHSLGGVMASRFASENKMIDRVVLLSAYPMGDELKNMGKDVLSIWGSKDGVVNFKNLIKSKEKLPKDTKYVEIEGANHSQFGDYGDQKGDNEAIISQEKQMEITSKHIVQFINDIN